MPKPLVFTSGYRVAIVWLSCGYRVAIEWPSCGHRCGSKYKAQISSRTRLQRVGAPLWTTAAFACAKMFIQ